MSVDPRVEKNTGSVVALRSFLIKVLQNPAAFSDDVTLIKALQSQGGLSKYQNAARGIHATSLNTIKRISDNVLQEGFEDIDRLRIAALNAINKHKDRTVGSNKTTKVGLKRLVEEKDEELQQALQDLWHITMALERSLSQGRYYAQQADNPTILALWLKEQRELRAMLSLRKHPVAKKPGKGNADERS